MVKKKIDVKCNIVEKAEVMNEKEKSLDQSNIVSVYKQRINESAARGRFMISRKNHLYL